MRVITFTQACAQYPNRYTCDHVPTWASKPHLHNGGESHGKETFYAPQYASDVEWYERTMFSGESELATSRYCYSQCPSWPMGKWLSAPFTKGAK